jgi:hypothetical protein
MRASLVSRQTVGGSETDQRLTSELGLAGAGRHLFAARNKNCDPSWPPFGGGSAILSRVFRPLPMPRTARKKREKESPQKET